MKTSLVLVSSLLLLSIAIVDIIHAEHVFRSQVVEETYQFTISWAIEEPDVTITASAKCTCWLGVGWHRPGSSDLKMTNADIIVATFDAKGSASLTNYWSLTTGFPQVNPTPAIIQGSGYQIDGYSFLQFRRPLATNTSTNNDLIVNGSTNFIWAHGNMVSANPNQFSYHGQVDTNRGVVTIDLTTGEIIIPEPANEWLPRWHGALMIFAFGFCLSFGVFTARYLKYYYWWFPLHIFTQVSGTLAAIAGFIIAFVMAGEEIFDTVHSFFGIAVVFLSIVSCVLGATSHFMYDPNRPKIPVFPDRVHWWIARICVVVSYVTIILGMRQLEVPIQMDYTFAGLVAFYIIIYIYLDVYSWKSKKLDDVPNPHAHD